MTTDRYTIRPFREGDELDIESGFERAFHKRRAAGEWRWKFPAVLGERTVEVARDELGSLAAHYAASPVVLQRPERRFLAGQVVDVFTLQKSGLFRRSGLLSRTIAGFLASFCGPDRLELLYGFPSLRAAALGRVTEVYPVEAPVPRRERSPTGPLARLGLARFVAEGFDAAGLDGLWRRAAHRYPWAAIRDAAWHRRRFLDRPEGRYLHLTVRRGGETRAAAVLRADQATLLWADLVWDGRDPDDLVLLESEVRRRARGAGADRIELWLAGDRQAGDVLSGLGWPERNHPDLLLVVRSFVTDASHEEIARRLYFTLADSDLV
jgi:hypothetical protein